MILELTKSNPSQAAKHLNCSREKAYRWYYRTKELISQFEQHPLASDREIERYLRLFLKDNIRSGAPLVYSPEQQCAIVAMATEKPGNYGVEADTWTHRELAMVANRDGITASISPSTVGRILAEADIKPHRSKYWEFPNIEDIDEFNGRVSQICAIYCSAEENLQNNIHTVSVDEKTGMQALERINPDRNALPGNISKLEFEYKRHGSFKSTDDLKERIDNFIEYYNQTMSKAFKWTYKGKLLQA